MLMSALYRDWSISGSILTHCTLVSPFAYFANKVYPDQTSPDELSDQVYLICLCVAHEEIFSFFADPKIKQFESLIVTF